LLVLWSRLGNYDRSIVERLTYQERRMFEHAAFYVPIERLPGVRFQQTLFANAERGSGAAARRWIEANSRFRDSVLAQLKVDAPERAQAHHALGPVALRGAGVG
jgi:uncharacterized protein YcaQ